MKDSPWRYQRWVAEHSVWYSAAAGSAVVTTSGLVVLVVATAGGLFGLFLVPLGLAVWIATTVALRFTAVARDFTVEERLNQVVTYPPGLREFAAGARARYQPQLRKISIALSVVVTVSWLRILLGGIIRGSLAQTTLLSVIAAMAAAVAWLPTHPPTQHVDYPKPEHDS